jgi:hypothetical protein
VREGVFAAPFDDLVRVTFDDVPFGKQLELFAGFTDWVVDNEAKQKVKVTDPVTVTVKSGNTVLGVLDVPLAKGWRDAPPIDTSALDGKKGELVVEVAGKKRDEPGFLFDVIVR